MSGYVQPLGSAVSNEAQPYRVKLAVFEGPLDLLLHLIEKQELDITKVSLVAVTDQYLEYISAPGRISAENLAEFLVMAAKLLLIKSRALLPTPFVAPGGEEQEYLGEELARQLLEYKRLRELAQQLREREELGLRAYLRLAPLPRLERQLDLTGVSLDDFIAAARQALFLEPPSGPVDEVIAPITITIADRIQHIDSLLARNETLNFNRLLCEAGSRPAIIITFLALLELIKAGRVQVQQERLFGEILIFRTETPQPVSAAQEPPQ